MTVAVKRASAKRTSAVKAVGKRPGSKRMTASKVVVLVATRKGAWLYRSDAARKAWRADGPHFLGHIVHHMVLDPRDGKTLLAAARTGHLGPTIFRSTDMGRNWKEAKKPPAFAKARKGETPRAVDHVFWFAPAHKDEANVWYAGTSPQGLFRSTDGGKSGAPFSSLNNNPKFFAWMGGVQDGTPDGPKLHSITVDPRDRAHLYIAMSGSGVHETIDGGKNWSPLVDGLEVVDGLDAANIAFHDPHWCSHLSKQSRPALPAEPLRHISPRPARNKMAPDREKHAQTRWRYRFSHGGASARRQHGLCISDGRHHGVATHQPRRLSGSLCDT